MATKPLENRCHRQSGPPRWAARGQAVAHPGGHGLDSWQEAWPLREKEC
jgi:hypothetical protein